MRWATTVTLHVISRPSAGKAIDCSSCRRKSGLNHFASFPSGRLGEAERNLVKLIETAPQQVTAHFVLAELYLATGRQVQAIDHYRRVLELNRFFTPLAHDGLVRALIDLGLEDQVAEVLDELRAMPDDAGWWPSVFLVAALETAPPDNESLQELRMTGQELSWQRPSDSAFALAMIELLEGNYPAARDLLEQGEPRLAGALGELPVDGYWRMLICPYAHVLIELGEVERGQAIANWLLNRIETGPDLARFKHLDPVVCQTALGDQVRDRLPPISPCLRQSDGKRSRFARPGAGAGRATPDRARAQRDLKSVFYSSVRQADTRDRRRAAFCPQAGKILAGQVIQYPLDHRRVFDTRDDLDRAAALRAGLDVDLEHSLEALCPAHRCLLLCRRTILFSRRLDRPGTPAPPGRHDPGPVGVVGREHPVEAGEVQARRSTRLPSRCRAGSAR